MNKINFTFTIMKKILLTFTLFFIHYSLVNAQSTIAVSEYSLQTLREDLRLVKFNEASTNREQYFNFVFNTADVSGFKEKEKLRYNAFLDQFEFIRDGYLYQLDKNIDQVITFDNKDTYKYATYLLNNELETRYLKVLSPLNKKYVLYKKLMIDATDALGTNGFTNTDSSGKRYTKEEKLLIGNDETLYVVPGSAKKLNQLLNVDIESFVKENKLSLRKESDLIKLMEYLNK